MKIFLSIVLFFVGLQFIEQETETYSILYFYNPDCPGCREIEPFINYLQEEYELKILRYNTRTSVGIRYGMLHRIRFVPTMIIIIRTDEEPNTKRYVGIESIRDAEKLIADLTNKEKESQLESKKD